MISLMRILSVMLAGTLCASCATTGELRETTPVVNERSSRPTTEIVACVSDVLSGQRLIFSILPRQSGSAITLGPTHNADMVADIETEGGATAIRIYRMPRMYFGLSRSFINTVLECGGLPRQE